jgi:hypothetical protein
VRPERNVQWNGERNAAQGPEPGAPADMFPTGPKGHCDQTLQSDLPGSHLYSLPAVTHAPCSIISLILGVKDSNPLLFICLTCGN